MDYTMDRERLQKRLDIVQQNGHSDRFGKYSTNQFSCVYVWSVTKYTVKWEEINNGVRVGLKRGSRAKFVKDMLAQKIRVHWTVGA